MNISLPIDDSRTPEEIEAILVLAERFEEAWNQGASPCIEDFLAKADEPLRPRLLRELIGAEVERRRSRGEAPQPAEYLARFPGHGAAVAAVLGTDTTGSMTTGPALPPVPAPVLPSSAADRFGNLRFHARGGLGEVFRARDEEVRREVALKRLRPDRADDPQSRARFLLEAEITGGLEHPGIVPIYGLGQDADGRPYYSMKFIQGESLKDALARIHDPGHVESRPGEIQKILPQFQAVCDVIAYAHSRGVIHRDLKPANVMLGPYGETLVVDWGLAKATGTPDPVQGTSPTAPALVPEFGAGVQSTADGQAFGTLAYMPPEQACGEGDQIDERADVFALGAILCEVLTGRPAHTGSTSAEILARAQSGDLSDAFARLDTCGADAELIALARHCLASEPADRPRHAGAVAEALATYFADVQDRLRAAELARVAADTRAAEERKRRRLAVALAASVLLVLGLTGGGVIWLEGQRLANETRLGEAISGARTLHVHALGVGLDPAAWAEARASAEGLDRLAGSLRLGPAARRRAETLRAEILQDAEAANAAIMADRLGRELADRIVSIRSAQQEVGDAATAAAYANAYAAYGLDLRDDADPLALADRIVDRPGQDLIAVASGLDSWAMLQRM